MFNIEEMRAKFTSLFATLGGQSPNELGDGATNRFAKLERAYSSERRKYHTLEHVYWVLRRIDDMADDARVRGAKFDEREWNVLRWAAWYHDFVLSGAPNDEALSAEEAALAFPGMRWPSSPHPDGYEAARLIRATEHDRIPLDHQAARLCDADLSILGADPEHFDRYEEQVREEWAHVPDELFKTARAVILKRFTDRPWIYMTDYGRLRWERKARENLKRSLAKLGSAEQ